MERTFSSFRCGYIGCCSSAKRKGFPPAVAGTKTLLANRQHQEKTHPGSHLHLQDGSQLLLYLIIRRDLHDLL